MRPYNFEASGSILTKLFQTTCRETGDNVGTTFRKACPLNIERAKKRPNLGAIFDSFRIWSQISLERIDISKIGEKLEQLQNPFHVWQKTWWTLDHKQNWDEIQWCILTHPNGFFKGNIEPIPALKGCYPFKCLHVLEIDSDYLVHPHRWSPQKI